MSDIEISDGPKESPKAENTIDFSAVMKGLSLQAEKLNTTAQPAVDRLFPTAGEIIAGCLPTEKICIPRVPPSTGDPPTWPKPQPQPKPKH